MEKFRGTLHIRLCNADSRSEGWYPYLVCEDREYELCREGGLPFNDPYYEPYNDKEVDICGYVSHDALVVESIEVVACMTDADTEAQDVEATTDTNETN